MNLNSTVVFLGIAYIQQSVARNLGFLIPFTSVLLALLAIHMVRNNLTFKPKKGTVKSPGFFTISFLLWLASVGQGVSVLCRQFSAHHAGCVPELSEDVLPAAPPPGRR